MNNNRLKKKLFPLLVIPFLLVGCSKEQKEYVLNESTFFLVMTNIQYYPEDYVGKNITFDCFTYELLTTENETYLCGVRKCASGFGCKCGKDTIIGFIMEKDIGLPEPKNQYENTNDKAWIHVTGQLETDEKTTFKIFGADNSEEEVQFLSFKVESFSLIEDYSNLHYYVEK